MKKMKSSDPDSCNGKRCLFEAWEAKRMTAWAADGQADDGLLGRMNRPLTSQMDKQMDRRADGQTSRRRQDELIGSDGMEPSGSVYPLRRYQQRARRGGFWLDSWLGLVVPPKSACRGWGNR